jgi:hypothetical protein
MKFTENLTTPWVSSAMEMPAGYVSDPATVTYMGITTGETLGDAKAGVDSIKITYTNADNAEDYVTFLCVWDFTSASFTSGSMIPKVSVEPVAFGKDADVQAVNDLIKQ